MGKKITITEETIVTYYYSYSMALYRNDVYLPLSFADETIIYSLLPALLIFTASEN